MIRRIDCDACNGSGIQECPRCYGEGENSDGTTCSYCGGLGDIACPHCHGSGTVEVEVNDEWAAMGW